MKKIILIFIVVFCQFTFADPHWYEPLNPYKNDDQLRNDLKNYSKSISVDVQEYKTQEEFYVGDDRTKVEVNKYSTFRYMYVINIENVTDFYLDLSCEDIKMAGVWEVNSDPLQKNPKHTITKLNEIHFKLNLSGGKQVMWFYSSMSPVNRKFTIKKSNSEDLVNGEIEAPGCKFYQEIYIRDNEKR